MKLMSGKYVQSVLPFSSTTSLSETCTFTSYLIEVK